MQQPQIDWPKAVKPLIKKYKKEKAKTAEIKTKSSIIVWDMRDLWDTRERLKG
jgi:hypothetical protein